MLSSFLFWRIALPLVRSGHFDNPPWERIPLAIFRLQQWISLSMLTPEQREKIRARASELK